VEFVSSPDGIPLLVARTIHVGGIKKGTVIVKPVINCGIFDVIQFLLDTPHVNGPSYKKWNLSLPQMATLHRLSHQILSDVVDMW
jgi:hypothetical protein